MAWHHLDGERCFTTMGYGMSGKINHQHAFTTRAKISYQHMGESV